jgi:hypothetical protein
MKPIVSSLAVVAITFALPAGLACADETAPAPLAAPSAASTPATPPATPAPMVELSADAPNATIEKRVGTTSPNGVPLLETGIFSVGQWQQACVVPCQQRLDPNFTYRVAGDGLVPTGSFALPRGGDRVRVDAKLGDSNARMGGAVLTGLGIAGIALGGLALIATPILESEDVGSKGFRTGVLAGGVGAVSLGAIALTAGLFMWFANGSHVRTESPMPFQQQASR